MSTDRVPPHNLEAEESVLGSMLLSKDAIAEVLELLHDDDFYRPAHRTVFSGILSLYAGGEAIDAITVAEHLRRGGVLEDVGGAPFLFSLVEGVPTAANAGYYARIVKEAGTLRRLIDAGTRIVQLGFETPQDVERAVDGAESLVYQVAQGRVTEDYHSLRDVITETLEGIERLHNDRREITGVPTGFPDLDRLTSGLQPSNLIIIAARPAIGKALALDTPLPTPNGWTTMGDVAVGDQLVGADGKPTTVVAATDVLDERPCYEVEFSDGTIIVADGEHQWLTETRSARKSAWAADRNYNRTRTQRIFPSVKTTEEVARTVYCNGQEQRLNHAVANTRPLDLPERELPLPPYALGVWLGDGHTASARITTSDPEIVMHLEADGLEVEPEGHLVYSLRLAGRAPVAERSCRNRHGTAQAILRTLGVLGSKQIPIAYLRASEAQRRALLAGLLDTDGTVSSAGSIQFCVTSQRLAEDTRELIVSLGYRCALSLKRVKGRTEASSTAYTLTFSTTDEVFRLERKRLVHKERQGPGRTGKRFITAVRRVSSVPVRCVQVDSLDRLYLASRSMIPTHNSTLGLDIARHASVKAGVPAVIFSLEMSKTELVQRLMCAECTVDMQRLRTGRMEEGDWARLTRSLGKLAEAPLFIDDSANTTMMEIRAKCRRLKQRSGLGLVVVDYLQLMQPARRSENRQQEVSEMSRAMKLLAKEIEVPVIAISQLSRQTEARADRRPMLADLRESGCLPASTRLLRADNGEEITLGELVLTQIQPDVVAVDDRYRLVPSRLTKAFPSGIKPVFRLRLNSGREVEATANHRFLTIDGWMRLDELAPGVAIAVPRVLPPPQHTTDWDDDRLVLLAHLLGDGSIGPNGVKYATADPANKAAVEDAASRTFGIAVSGKKLGRTWQLWLPSPTRLTHNKVHPVRSWLEPYGLWGSRSATKFVPEALFGLPDAKLALFLRHLWATDGSITITRNGRGSLVRTYYASTSRRLAENVQRALLRFDIRSRLLPTTKYGFGVCWNVVIQGSENQVRFMHSIGCHGERGERIPKVLELLGGLKPNPNVDLVPWAVAERVKNAIEKAGLTHREIAARLGERYSGSYMLGSESRPRRFSRSRLARIAEITESDELLDLATSDIYWDAVAAIEPLGQMPVFDATVEGTHNFIANGIVAHNSLEQDADMVMFIYRDEVYDPESPRKGEADFILAKHRNGPTDTVTVTFQGQYSRFAPMAPRSM